MLQLPDAEKKYDLAILRLCTGGGESLTAPTYHAWKEKFGLEIFEGQGTTEMMYVFVSNVVSRRARPGSFGQAVPGYEVKVVNEEDKAAPPGQIGRFLARGPTATLYWRDDEKQRHAVTPDGWNRVGDYVFADEEGYLWFVSREDDIIKSSAYRIGPEEIESTIATHPAVADVGVIGVPDEVRGQIAKAFVVLAPGKSATPEELIEYCRGKIATYKLPREVVFVKELPRTPTGKLLRRVLRQTAAQAPVSVPKTASR
jgi:2-aminobenzoate-CoA ligase